MKSIDLSCACTILAMVTLGICGGGPAFCQEEDGHLATVAEILEEIPLIDGHNDAPWQIREYFSNHLGDVDFQDTSSLEEPMHTDLSRLRQGGVGGQFWSVWVPTDTSSGDAVIATLEQIDLVHRLVARYPQDLELALTADDIVRIHGEGRIASLMGVEGGHSMGDSLAVLRMLHDLGARYLTLTHWEHVPWADAATAAPVHDGLTAFGQLVVKEMNRLGMMVDLSHVSEAVMEDVLEITQAPVLFSHSSAKAVNPHPRNVSDEILKRLPENGGVVMVNFGSYFIDAAVVERYAARKAEEARLEAMILADPEAVEHGLEQWKAAHPPPTVPLSMVADHIDHIRKIAGIDHVGLGSDFDGVGALPEGLEDVSGYPRLLAELLKRGYSRDDVGKIAGLNVLRVMRGVEAAALRLRDQEPTDVSMEEADGGKEP